MEITGNLSRQPFSTGSGRIILKNYVKDYFDLLESPDFRLWFSDVLVLIRGFLLYFSSKLSVRFSIPYLF